MTDKDKTKIWKDYGFFETYEQASKELQEIKNKFDLCKIRLIREKSKQGWFKIKVWSKTPSSARVRKTKK